MADHEFLFDVKLNASLRVRAETEAAARAILNGILDCADTHFGSLKDGSPVIGEASLCDGDDACLCAEIDGESPAFPSDLHYHQAAMNHGWLPSDSDTAKEYCLTHDIDASAADVS